MNSYSCYSLISLVTIFLHMHIFICRDLWIRLINLIFKFSQQFSRLWLGLVKLLILFEIVEITFWSFFFSLPEWSVLTVRWKWLRMMREKLTFTKAWFSAVGRVEFHLLVIVSLLLLFLTTTALYFTPYLRKKKTMRKFVMLLWMMGAA